MRRVLAAIVCAMVLVPCAESEERRQSGQQKTPIVFMCPYGGAKSVVAASYFNRMAEQQKLPFTGVAVAADIPYTAVPPKVAEYLGRDGFEVGRFKPRRIAPSDLERAARIVSIDCDLTRIDLRDAAVERWDDVPRISEDLAGSVAAIRKHVADLVRELAAK